MSTQIGLTKIKGAKNGYRSEDPRNGSESTPFNNMDLCSAKLSVLRHRIVNGFRVTQAIFDWKRQWHGIQSRILVGSRDIGGNSNRYGSTVQGVEVRSKSRGKHHCRC